VGQRPQRKIELDEAAETVIERYGDLSGDKAAFTAALETPLPVCLWANSLRIKSKELEDKLIAEGFDPSPVAWNENAYRLPPGSRPGRSWLHKAGLLQIQEEAALLPVKLLAPQRGECILDLCAAPGNKAAQIAIALENRGTVIANDSHVGRLAPFQAAIARLGFLNVTTTTMDGAQFPLEAGPFDRVLADVPCSGEGTIRKGPGKHTPVPDNFRDWLRGKQRALLRRAIDLCKPGGRVVYSTCTFAPEENEEIIDAILSERSDVELISPEPTLFGTSTGISKWQGRCYSQELANTMRIWPHLSGTGGFFAAVMVKSGPSSKVLSDKTPEIDANARQVMENFIKYFGLPSETFDGLQTVRAGRRLKLVATDHRIPELEEVLASGLTLTGDSAKVPKLSTEAAMAFGSQATRNVVDLDDDQRTSYLSHQTLTLSPDQCIACNDRGYVIVRSEGLALGVGMIQKTADTTSLESLFPQNWP
tara:strand:- start:2819 stop:4252 length:1434 start_codon:yes stop_codon:yes gene_type:complete